ncbi:MAG: thioesterase family protein [Anaerolineae bacterium]|nr:thioesterase family protein [Anaerolineae bacterium]
MAVVYTGRWVVRDYECDAYGHLNNANYVRYMQEAAFAASAAVGYPKARYEALQRLWLARETEIEYLQPLHDGDEVEITTWVADFRQVRSLRRYEFRRAGEDALVARASTDWVYLDRDSGQVIAVPPEVVRAYAGEDPVERLARAAFPAPPAPPAGAFTLRQRVEWRDIDAAHHLNNAAYLNHIEDSAIHAAAAYGWPPARCREAGFAMVAHRHHIEYQQPAVIGDELDITTWLFEVKRFLAMRHYAITRVRDGAPIAQAQTQWVAIRLDTGKSVRVPPEMLDDLAPNIA